MKEEHKEKHPSAKKEETITLEKATLWKIGTGIFALLFLVTLLNGGLFGTSQQAPNAPAPSAQPGGGELPTVSVDMKKLADDDAALGDANAPITMIEFSDFQCPFCRRHYFDSHKQIVDNYVKTGKVKIIYRDFPLGFHQGAQPAAEATECAEEQGKFWEMHDKIFEEQNKLGQGTVQFTVDDLKSWATDIGLDSTKFNTCLDSGKYKSEVQKDLQDGSASGVQGTPGFFIGKTNGNTATFVAGAYPYATLAQVIEEQLK